MSKKTDATLESAAEETAKAVSSIINIYDSHGVTQGTPEEAITAAQGAIMLKNKGLWTPFDHGDNLIQTRDSLDANITKLYKHISDVKRLDRMCASRLVKIAEAITPIGAEYKQTLGTAVRYVDELKSSAYTRRLEGVMFEPMERGRDGLVSTQLERGQFRRMFKTNERPSIYPVLDHRTLALDQAIKRMPASKEQQMAINSPLKNFLDREVNSSAGMNNGAATMLIFHQAFKRRF